MNIKSLIVFIVNSLILALFSFLIIKFVRNTNDVLYNDTTTNLLQTTSIVSEKIDITTTDITTTEVVTTTLHKTQEKQTFKEQTTKLTTKQTTSTTTSKFNGYSYTIRKTSTAPTTISTTYKRPTTTKIPIKTNSVSVPVTTQSTTKISSELKEETANNYNKAMEILEKVNELRKEVNLKSLTYSSDLSACANIRAHETNNNYSHYRPDGNPYYKVLDEYNISYNITSENIARGYTDYQELVTAWKNSKEHYKAIITTSYTKCGIGIYNNYYVLILTD